MSSLRPCGREKEWRFREDRARKRHGMRLGPEMCKHKFRSSKHIVTYSYRYVSGRANAVTLRNRIEARVGIGRRENKTRKHEVEWYLLYTASRTDSLQSRRVAYNTYHLTIHCCPYTSEQQSHPWSHRFPRCECTSVPEKGLRRLCETAY